MLKSKQFSKSLIAAIFLLAFSSCVYEKEDILYPPGNCNTDNPTYSLMVQPIISANCYSCHSTANSAVSGGGNQLDSYVKLKVFVDNGKLVGSISHSAGFSPMPKNSAKLNDCDINKIKAWVAAGAPNN
jgi:hypothetical protein